MTHYRCRPSPVASFLWLIFFLALIPASFQTPGMWWFGLVVAAILVLGTLGKLAERNQRRQTATVARRPATRRWHFVERRRGLAPCTTCGAPNRGSDFCPFCSSALVTRREVRGVSEGLS